MWPFGKTDKSGRSETAPADWRAVHVGVEGDGFKVAGLEVWKHEWRSTALAPVELPHPSYPGQIHRYNVYEIGAAERTVRFAADELSNGVWGFYLPV